MENIIYDLKGITALLHSITTGSIEKHNDFKKGITVIEDKLYQLIKEMEDIEKEEKNS